MRSLKLVCVCVTILGIVLCVGCKSEADALAVVKTKNILRDVGKLIGIAEEVTDQQPPITLPELVTWLAEVATPYDRYVDAEAKTIIDAWGRPIVLVVHGGKLVALGSKGPDGEWEGGKGDDVYLDLNELRTE